MNMLGHAERVPGIARKKCGVPAAVCTDESVRKVAAARWKGKIRRFPARRGSGASSRVAAERPDFSAFSVRALDRPVKGISTISRGSARKRPFADADRPPWDLLLILPADPLGDQGRFFLPLELDG